MTRTLVRAHDLLTQSNVHGNIPAGALIVEDGVIRRVATLAALEQAGPFDAVIGDPTRHLVLPGFVNGHHHCLRPMWVGYRATPFEELRAQQQLMSLPPISADEAYDFTLWGALQFLKSGATAVVDHYPFDPRMEDLGVPATVAAYADAGVRAAVCISCSDRKSTRLNSSHIPLSR